MDGTKYTATVDEFKLFHGIDRALYVILMRDLGRHPLECLYVLALWLWMERAGFYNLIGKILPLPGYLINELADEAVTCIKCVNAEFPFSSKSADIPRTRCLVKREIFLQFFDDNWVTASDGIQSLVTGVCVPLVSDILEWVIGNNSTETQTQTQTVVPSHGASTSSSNQMRGPPPVGNSSTQSITSLGVSGDSSTSRCRARTRAQVQAQARALAQAQARAMEMSEDNRTMFATFSKGYPVTEDEVRRFFLRLFGHCIESFHMQGVKDDKQSLYAKIVFFRKSVIRAILNGTPKAKFTINGKHVWMRKFVVKNN